MAGLNLSIAQNLKLIRLRPLSLLSPSQLASHPRTLRWTGPPRKQQRHQSCSKQLLPPRMTIARAARLFRSSKITSKQLCEHCYNLACFGDDSLRLNSYAKILPLEQILKQSFQSDERIRNGDSKGLLDGIPVTIKANIAVGRYWELPNACSAILCHDRAELDDTTTYTSDNHIYESDIAMQLLKDCGAVLIGITNMDEFGMGSLGINNGLHRRAQQKGFSPTYNPVPWMQRLASLLDSTEYRLTKDCEYDNYWIEKILNSTPANPHGVRNESRLEELLEEVQQSIHGVGTEGNNFYTNEYPLLSPGGSSSGAAVATCHGSSLVSFGTDTGGSLRLPSAWTSTVGFKPTYGTFSRYGVVSYVSSLDTVGFITGSTECAKIAYSCLIPDSTNAFAHEDSISWDALVSRDSTAIVYHKESKICDNDSRLPLISDEHAFVGSQKALTNIRVGIPSAFSLEEIPPTIALVWSESARYLQNVCGATLVTISESKLQPALIRMALASYYVLACAEASSNLSRYDGLRFGKNANVNSLHLEYAEDLTPLCDMTALEKQISTNRAHGFGKEVQRRVLAGTSVLSSDRFHTHYEAAAVARAKISRSLGSIFRDSLMHEEDDDKVDVILVPTALTYPPKLIPAGDEVQVNDPTEAFANDVMTIPISLGGFPSVSVPVNFETLNIEIGCPETKALSNMIGMQIFAPRGSDALVLKVANALEK